MPGSDDGKYEEQVDEETVEEKPDKKSKKNKKEKKEKKEDDEAHDDDDDLQASRGVDDYSEASGLFSKTLHVLMLIMLSTTLICLLAIIPSRSLGTAVNFSVGAWEACYNDYCYSDLGCDTATNQSVTGVFGIIAIIHSFIMLILQFLEFQKPGRFPAFPKIQAVLNHLLWLWVLVSWACWASVRSTYHDCPAGPEIVVGHFYYAWGFVFLVGMWLTHFFLAIILTLKAAGKKVCGL